MSFEPLFARRTVGLRLGLEIIEPAHAALGRPAADIPAIHVVGTNGKGSIAAMAAHALHSAGLRVGLYTSPHLEHVQERVRIDGEPVAREELEQAVKTVLEVEQTLAAPRPLSFFEVLTCAAMRVFETHAPDVLVVEAGLGGRLDATRIVEAKAVAFGSIAMDHERFLGSSLAAIAGEKAAVLRSGVPAFTAAQAPEAMAVMTEHARFVGCPLHVVPPLECAPASLPGEHQRSNAAVALAAARVFDARLDEGALEGVRWPGRLEVVPCGEGVAVFDVAHNPAGVEAVVRWLQTRTQVLPEPWAVLFGCQDDKDGAGMLAHLHLLAAPLWRVPLPDSGAVEQVRPNDRAFAGLHDERLHAAIFEHLREGGTLVVCGSHVLVGAIRGLIRDGALRSTHDQDPRGTPSV